jgi:hypothetical protein
MPSRRDAGGMKSVVSTLVAAPLREVRRAHAAPARIRVCNMLSPDARTASASVELRPGAGFPRHVQGKPASRQPA